ncbi:MAG: Aspartate 1-decarboxylase precursor [bacterium ADurb.Bin429]|nr:MAG: Aspartate 1-decarboxylase precursor [bacterium ADurb.Bin429]
MYLTLCKSKIHRATVTEADLHYVGSITIDAELMAAANMLPYERAQVLNLDSGARIETYVIVGEAGSGIICLNGPAAHHFHPGQMAIVIAYAQMTPEEAENWRPTVVFVDEANKITRISDQELPLSTE